MVQESVPPFEVASVRPSARGTDVARFSTTPNRLIVENFPLRLIISQVYRVGFPNLIGGPDWIDSQHFDIDAVSASRVSGAQLFLMTQRLLEERFALRVHREQRPLPIFALVRANATADGGPFLRRSSRDCDAVKPSPCYLRVQPGNAILAAGWDWSVLFRQIRSTVDRPVVDDTGLSGQFDMQLRWSSAGPETIVDPRNGSIDVSVPIATALRDQLGLKMESRVAPVDVLVIDSVSLPTPN